MIEGAELSLAVGHEPILLLWTVTIALALDLAFGEPSNAFHPVAHLGAAISWWEQRLYLPPPDSLAAEGVGRDSNRLRGSILLVIIVGGSLVVGLAAVKAIALLTAAVAARFADFAVVSHVLAVAICLKPCFALRALVEEGAIQRRLLFRHRLLSDGDASPALTEARERLRHLCSRSTTQLSQEEIAEVTISSMAENLCDSFVAPLLFYALFGLPGAIAYRAINTLDAMVGYRGRYEFFGRPAARLDDVANLVPARLTGALIIAGGWLMAALSRFGLSIDGTDGRSPRVDPHRGLATMLRDHPLTPSPNGGWPMAAMAGVLGVQLRKRGVYALGDRVQAASDHSIAASLFVTGWAAALAVLVTLALNVLLTTGLAMTTIPPGAPL